MLRSNRGKTAETDKTFVSAASTGTHHLEI